MVVLKTIFVKSSSLKNHIFTKLSPPYIQQRFSEDCRQRCVVKKYFFLVVILHGYNFGQNIAQFPQATSLPFDAKKKSLKMLMEWSVS